MANLPTCPTGQQLDNESVSTCTNAALPGSATTTILPGANANLSLQNIDNKGDALFYGPQNLTPNLDLKGLTLGDDGGDGGGAEATEVKDGSGVEITEVVKKKKNKKKVSKTRKRITGFEEFYADAPLTPEEGAEKKKIYASQRPFPERIEECIQRYRARRRMTPQRTDIFNKFLFLGGIDSSARQFSGSATDKEALAAADADEIRQMTAVDFVGGSGIRFFDGSTDGKDWEVDFAAVVKGFLSRWVIDNYMYDEFVIKEASALIKNFLNYVIFSDVCPEHHDNIIQARTICDIAPFELRQVHELALELPGKFNEAASSLFSHRMVDDLDQEDSAKLFRQFQLTALIRSKVASYKSESLENARDKIRKLDFPALIKVTSVKEHDYKITAIHRPDKKDRGKAEAADTDCEVNSAGILVVVPTIIAHGYGNMPRPEELDSKNLVKEEFILEDELLAKFEEGMTMRVTVCELDVGLRIIHTVHDIRPSFDTFLAQSLMLTFKEPRINDRPPPSVQNPDSDEDAFVAEMGLDD